MEKVRIVNTKSIFDNKTGIVEAENGDKVTVMVDFDDKHKVRNDFPRANLEEIIDEDVEFNNDVSSLSDTYDWEKYLTPVVRRVFSKDDIATLIDERGDARPNGVLEWFLSLRDNNVPDGWDPEWHDGNVNDMPPGLEHLNGFFDFETAYNLFTTTEVPSGCILYLIFMPEDPDDPDWEELTLLQREGGNTSHVAEDFELTPRDTSGFDTEVLALADLLDIEPEFIDVERETDTHTEYSIAEEEETHGGEVYSVYSSWDDAWAEAEEKFRDYLDDVGAVEAFGIGTVRDYLDSDYFNDSMQDFYYYYVYDMDYEDLIEAMENYNLINENDKIPDPDWEPDEDNPDDEADMIYPEDLIESKKDDLIEAFCDSEGDSVEWYMNTYGDADLNDYIRHNPSAIDEDRLVNDYLDVTQELGSYDGEEHYIAIETDSGRKEFYIYRQE